jgi:hypothetical protein
VWPGLVEASEFNDDLKPARRVVQNRNARKRAAKNAHAEFRN